jgi:fucose 4-O-acetylase-like acetyltransferase
MTTSRINWIDVLKGFVIVSVVLAHINFDYESVKLFIYLFHMPLFFFIGGYLFKPTNDYKEFLKKKAIHLLIPYCLFIILIYIPQASVIVSEKSESAIMTLLRPIFGGRLFFVRLQSFGL